MSPEILAHLHAAGAGREVQVVHRHQDAPLRRLEPVAHVGQRPADDHAHRVREVAVLELVLDRQIDQPRRDVSGRSGVARWVAAGAAGAAVLRSVRVICGHALPLGENERGRRKTPRPRPQKMVRNRPETARQKRPNPGRSIYQICPPPYSRKEVVEASEIFGYGPGGHKLEITVCDYKPGGFQ